MAERSQKIFGNEMSSRAYLKAVRSKVNYIKKFGDDSNIDYPAYTEENEHIGQLLGVRNVQLGKGVPFGQLKKEEPVKNGQNGQSGDDAKKEGFDTEKGVIVGNIRMGFGHYRISMAIASAAHALGYTPYWMDLNSYPETTCTKVISSQNDLYSMGSRMSQKSKVFNKVVWEPMNYEGFRQLSYNASDQKNAELMAPVFRNVPKDIPLVATHVWPAQAALHAGMKHVVNAIPDNWPMALHLAEGSLHTVQTHYAYQGYRILNGMQKKKVLEAMPGDSLIYTGHYVDHELVANIEKDCDARVQRKKDGQPMRFLLTIGGAGAQGEIFKNIIRALMPKICRKEVALYVNVGDYQEVWEKLVTEIRGLDRVSRTHFDDWAATQEFAEKALTGRVVGVHAFFHQNIFEAVYATNLLMPVCDLLVTKPSELAYYPIPKLYMKHIGGHEVYGAIHAQELGDATPECQTPEALCEMIDTLVNDRDLLRTMNRNILKCGKDGVYNGGYEVVKLAAQGRPEA